MASMMTVLSLLATPYYVTCMQFVFIPNDPEISVDCSDLNGDVSWFNTFGAAKQCAFPYRNLQRACVVQSCPALSTSGLCPFDTSGEANESAVASGLSLMTQCLSASTSVCNVSTEAYAIPRMRTLAAAVHFYFASGSRLRMRDLSLGLLLGDRKSLTLNISATLVYQTQLTGNLRLRYNHRLTQTLVQPVYVETKFNDLSVNFTVHTVNLVDLHLTPPTPTPNMTLLSETDVFAVRAGQLTNSTWSERDVIAANRGFKAALKYLLLFSRFSTATTRFLTTYVGYGLMEMDSTCLRNKA